MKQGEGQKGGSRWFGTAISLLIFGAFVLLYIVRDRDTTRQAIERNQRVLAAARDALQQSMGDVARARVVVRTHHPACHDGIRIEIPTENPTHEASVVTRRDREPQTYCIDYDALLQSVPRADEAFDKVLLVEGKARILEQSGQEEVPSLTSLRSLSLVDDGKERPVELDKVGPIATVHLGDGTPFSLSCQPVTSVVDGDADGADSAAATLHLCGLVREQRMHMRLLFLPATVLFVLSLLLALTLLVPPFAKIRLLSPTERIRFADVFAAGACTLLGLVLLTTAGQGFFAYSQLTAFSDGQLRKLSQLIVTDLDEELNAARRQLRALDSLAFSPDEVEGVRHPRASERSIYPYEAVSWADAAGVQRIKLSVLDDSHLLDLAGRQYFRQALGSPHDVVIVDSVRTLSTGRTRTILAQAAAAPRSNGAAAPKAPGVLLLSAELRSLTRPELPDGMGFAVVDETGNVLFHSDPLLSNSHNLLTESDENQRLRELLEGADDASRTGLTEDLSYWGTEHRAFVKPIPLPWSSSRLSLVVFEETAPLRRVVLRGFMRGLCWGTLYAAVWLGLVLLLSTFWRPRLGSFWPESDSKLAYAELFLVFVCLMGTAIWLRSGGPLPDGLSVVPAELYVCVVPVLVAVFSWLRFWHGRRRAPRRNGNAAEFAARCDDSGSWRAYSWAAVALWLLCAVIPPYVLASGTTEAEARRFAKHQSSVYFGLVTARTEELASERVRAEFATKDRPTVYIPTEYEGPSVDAFAAELGFAGTGFETKLLDALRFRPADELRADGAPRLFWLFVVFFVIAILGCVRLIVHWSAKTLLLRGIEAVRDRSPGEVLRAKVNSWCVVASPRGFDSLRRSSPVENVAGGPHVLWWPVSGPIEGFLERLEIWAEKGEPCIVVACQVPWGALRSLEAEGRVSSEGLQRWTSLLSGFYLVFSRPDRPSPTDAQAVAERLCGANSATQGGPRAAASDVEWLTREFCADRQVFEVCRESLSPGSLAAGDHQEMRRRVRDAAWGYYLELWNSCSKVEQLTLVQLSEEGFVNDQRREVVRVLLARGLLVRRPMLSPLNDSFASFCRAQGVEVGVRSWEAAPSGLSWQHLRAPAIVLFACTAYVLYFTQRAFIDSTLMFATTLAALLPQLGRLVQVESPWLRVQKNSEEPSRPA